jgi:hypothetical protein
MAAVSAAGLGLSVAANATGSVAQAPARPGVQAPQGQAPGSRHTKVQVLAQPTKRFNRSLEVAAHRKTERRQHQAAGGAAARSGSFPTPASVGVSSATLNSIAACESGGDPTAVSVDGTYRGKYQFDYSTWESVGGTGDPAAASVAEQDYRAALLYARNGSSPWPICGG